MNSQIQPKHTWLIRMRRWHRWSGVAAALFLIVFSVTGIVLNYKGPVLGALGLAPRKSDTGLRASEPAQPGPKRGEVPSRIKVSTAAGLDTLPISADGALQEALARWGDVEVERLELRVEQGRWVWKVRRTGGAELILDAASGEAVLRGRYERMGPSDASGQPVRYLDWGKLLLDLHTGRIGGAWGKAVMTVAAGVLLFLSLSGLYLWCKPLLIRHAKMRVGAQLAAVDAPRSQSGWSPRAPLPSQERSTDTPAVRVEEAPVRDS